MWSTPKTTDHITRLRPARLLSLEVQSMRPRIAIAGDRIPPALTSDPKASVTKDSGGMSPTKSFRKVSIEPMSELLKEGFRGGS